MQEKELKLTFECGALKSCTVTNAVVETGYVLQFEKKGSKGLETVEKRARLAKDKDKSNERVFKSIDGAIIFAHSIGFRKIIVAVEYVISQKKVTSEEKPKEESKDDW